MIAIDKGVPIPPKRGTKETIFPFATMVAGDSFARQPEQGQETVKLRQQLTAAAHSWAKRHAPGAKFTTRVEPDGKGVRIWLLTRPAPLAPVRVGELPVSKVHHLDDDAKRTGRALAKPPVAFDMPSFVNGGKPSSLKGAHKPEPEVMVKRVLDAAESSSKRVVKGSRY